MAKDYFQDIVPPQSDDSGDTTPAPAHFEPAEEVDADVTPVPIQTRPAPDAGRSIRNIAPAPRSSRPRFPAPNQELSSMPPARRRGGTRYVLWAAAFLGILVVAALVYIALRPTKVVIVPRTHTLNFAEEQFVAYPEASESAAGLTYTVETIELEDSEVVESQGTVYAEDKATGNVTVYNNFQTSPLTLVKNTRFQTASGLVFRTPAEIVVPGRQGSTPGKVVVTVVADQPGAQYNVAAGKFTLPGLNNNAAMFAQVYAESAEPFTGGFVGERPGVAPGALEDAISRVRARLEQKAAESVAQIGTDRIAFPDLVQIEYQSLPNTTEAGGGVRIHQKARVNIPTFSAPVFAAAVSSSAVSSGDTSNISLVKGAGFGASFTGTSTVLGATPVSFALSGPATLLWEVPTEEVQQALAGKDKTAFETIMGGFASVDDAKAHIEPFWKSSFPTDPEDIQVVVEDPSAAE